MEAENNIASNKLVSFLFCTANLLAYLIMDNISDKFSAKTFVTSCNQRWKTIANITNNSEETPTIQSSEKTSIGLDRN